MMELSANWKALQATSSQAKNKKRAAPSGNYYGKKPLKRSHLSTFGQESSKGMGIITSSEESTSPVEFVNKGFSQNVELGKYIGIDCEMVGVGPQPDRESALARVSIVNYNGDQVYDSFVQTKEDVTDWRTRVSGITPQCMREARSFEEVQADIAQILHGRILVGHAVRNDLDAILLGHPKKDIRDTSRHPPYRQLAGGGSPRLKVLALELLGLDIQSQAHSSVEDARATMLLFRRDKDAFEQENAKKWQTRSNVKVAKFPKKLKSKRRKKG